MNQTTAHWIDLPIVEHDLAGSNPFHIQGENGVPASVGSQNRSQLTKGREGCDALAFTVAKKVRLSSMAVKARASQPSRPLVSWLRISAIRHWPEHHFSPWDVEGIGPSEVMFHDRQIDSSARVVWFMRTSKRLVKGEKIETTVPLRLVG